MRSLSRWAPLALSLLRIAAALLFVEHGAMKLLHFPAPQPGAADPLPPLMMAAGVLELVGGGLLVLGLFTRPVAFLLSGQMAFAYWMVHAKGGPWPALNGGDAAILFCFVFFYLIFAGGGSIGIDAMRRKG